MIHHSSQSTLQNPTYCCCRKSRMRLKNIVLQCATNSWFSTNRKKVLQTIVDPWPLINPPARASCMYVCLCVLGVWWSSLPWENSRFFVDPNQRGSLLCGCTTTWRGNGSRVPAYTYCSKWRILALVAAEKNFGISWLSFFLASVESLRDCQIPLPPPKYRERYLLFYLL